MQPPSFEPDQFERFQQSLMCPGLIEFLGKGLIGEDTEVPGLNGSNPLIYADYVASGRALRQAEAFIQDEILPFYANSHTKASFCGQKMTRLRQRAREVIRTSFSGDECHYIIFTGSGAAGGINRLVSFLGVAPARSNGSGVPDQKAVVLIGPYEGHSNILPWREAGVEVIEIPECERGGLDIAALEGALKSNEGCRVIGVFSAMSSGTGIMTDVKKVTRLLKAEGAISIWDYSGGAPYLEIDMAGGTYAAIDAVVVSPHKFIGGPGASGVLVLSRETIVSDKQSLTDGGIERFVSLWAHDCSSGIVAREEASIPNFVGDLHGVQVKDGCAYAGPYAHRLLGIDRDDSEVFWAAILSGYEFEELGRPRLGFSVLMTDLKVERIIHAVEAVASLSSSELPSYKVDESSACFSLEVA
ncbi:MAG: aminotransferase class V-fold PLP-dependent enzyme [Pseudoruegeria sp.]